jgi:mono/diheme cytochrome c family protein
MHKKLGVFTLGMLFVGAPALADDMGSDYPGAALHEDQCASCHFEDDFSGESADAIATMIKGIRSGDTKHNPKLPDISDDEIKLLAEYYASQ